MPFAHIALPLPLFDPYTYRIPESLADRIRPGARVVVPLRQQELVGIVAAVGVDAPAVEAREILATPDPEPAITPALLETASWMARYYGTPIGLALRAMLPGGMWGRSTLVLRLRDAPAVGGTAGALVDWLESRGGEATAAAAARALRRPVWPVADRLVRIGALEVQVRPPDVGPAPATLRMVRLAGEPLTLVERERIFARRPRRRALYEALEQGGGQLAWQDLTRTLGFGDALIQALLEDGLAAVERVDTIRDPFADEPVSLPPAELTVAQQAALGVIDGLEPGTGALLFGVTGSGKTLVYLHAIRRARETGRGAILLVPEIALTPQTVSRVRGLFGDEVAVLHSALSDGERADAWRALRRGDRRIAIGARSAVFAPIRELGVIVVDEEHEASYKNTEAPRYHAREVAAMRARLEGATLLLGSATPSLDTTERIGPRLRRVDLPERIAERPMPPVTLVDLRSAPRVPGTGGVPWSEALDQAVGATLGAGDQVLLLLNRRGYASFQQCRECGHVPDCPRCSIALTVHRAPVGLRCHYCDHRAPLVATCAACGGSVQVERGVGTQQVERLATERFPEARLARMDLDTTSTRWAHQRILGAVGRGEVNLLIGTQMIAKGIDLPEVTLVGVVDADLALHLPDFRAAERTFQLLTQVAGRAGRGDRGGRVLIQTRRPEHHALVRAVDHDVDGFLVEERRQRESPPWPPVVALANLIVSGRVEAAVSGRAASLVDWCDELIRRQGLALETLGPAPCPVARIKDRWRWHAVVKGPPDDLGRFVRVVAPRLGEEAGVRIVLDRDPVSLL